MPSVDLTADTYRLPIALLIDTSEQLKDGDQLRRVNDELSALKRELVYDPRTARRVEIAVITFGGAVKVVSKFRSPSDWTVPHLHPHGEAQLGGSVLFALELLEDRARRLKTTNVDHCRPLLYLLSGSPAADQWQIAAKAARRAEKQRLIDMHMIGVGKVADIAALRSFSDIRRPVCATDHPFGEMFEWLGSHFDERPQSERRKVSTGAPQGSPPTKGMPLDGGTLSQDDPLPPSCGDIAAGPLRNNRGARRRSTIGKIEVPEPTTPPLVFFAYSRVDMSVADRLCADLAKAGVNLWRDKEFQLAGDAWREKIDGALRNAKFLIALLSRASCDSREFGREVDFAVGRGIPLLPVHVEDCDPRYHISETTLQAVRLYPDYATALSACIRRLADHSGYAGLCSK